MKHRKWFLTVAVLLVLVFMQGQGQGFYTGNQLVGDMREYEKADSDPTRSNYQIGHYTGFLTGICDSWNNIFFDAPGDVTRGQVNAIVAKYIKSHPERWNESAGRLIIDALKEAFPLPQKK